MTHKRTPDDVTILPRDYHFDMESAKKGYWLDGDPVATAVFNCLSLTFPGGERMFMDAVRAYRSEVSPKLAKDVKDFIAQEAIHSREHHLLNELIDREKYPVAEVEAEISERIAFGRSRGSMGMLISTICLEHFTAMMADMMDDHDTLFSKTEKPIADMWRWHAMEECEHKAVAYDVYLEVTKDWPPHRRYMRRCIAMALITYHFTRNIAGYAASFLEADGYTPQEAKRAVKKFLWKQPGLFGKGWKVWISWFKPGFHPWDHDNRALVESWRAEFDAAVPAE
ncbi:MAG: metal-dependent hydrolase [Hyphomonas sp.]|nr:metal-dependent hydrolase [Hyphomonas sp.]